MKRVLFITAVLLISATPQAQTKTLNQDEKLGIQYMREEEKLARDVYDSLFFKWNTTPFEHIRVSEQYHMDRVKALLDTFQMEDPAAGAGAGEFSSPLFKKYYAELVQSGTTDFTAALKAGAKIEELDIHDLNERIEKTSNTEILSAYKFLRSASYNHLRAFVRRMKMRDVVYEPIILSKEEFQQIVGGEINH